MSSSILSPIQGVVTNSILFLDELRQNNLSTICSLGINTLELVFGNKARTAPLYKSLSFTNAIVINFSSLLTLPAMWLRPVTSEKVVGKSPDSNSKSHLQLVEKLAKFIESQFDIKPEEALLISRRWLNQVFCNKSYRTEEEVKGALVVEVKKFKKVYFDQIYLQFFKKLEDNNLDIQIRENRQEVVSKLTEVLNSRILAASGIEDLGAAEATSLRLFSDLGEDEETLPSEIKNNFKMLLMSEAFKENSTLCTFFDHYVINNHLVPEVLGAVSVHRSWSDLFSRLSFTIATGSGFILQLHEWKVLNLSECLRRISTKAAEKVPKVLVLVLLVSLIAGFAFQGIDNWYRKKECDDSEEKRKLRNDSILSFFNAALYASPLVGFTGTYALLFSSSVRIMNLWGSLTRQPAFGSIRVG